MNRKSPSFHHYLLEDLPPLPQPTGRHSWNPCRSRQVTHTHAGPLHLIKEILLHILFCNLLFSLNNKLQTCSCIGAYR